MLFEWIRANRQKPLDWLVIFSTKPYKVVGHPMFAHGHLLVVWWGLMIYPQYLPISCSTTAALKSRSMFFDHRLLLNVTGEMVFWYSYPTSSLLVIIYPGWYSFMIFFRAYWSATSSVTQPPSTEQQVLPCKALSCAARNSRSATGWWRRRSTWRPHLSVWAQQWMGICVGDLVWTFLKEYPAVEILEIWSAVHRWGNSAAGGPGGLWNQSKAHKSCWNFGRGRIN